MYLNDFVTLDGYRQNGIGRLVALDEEAGTVEVEYFVAPGRATVDVVASLDTVRSVALERQTRVYVKELSGHGWSAGRVIETGAFDVHALDRAAFPHAPDEGRAYLVRFPKKADVALPPAEIFVRWAHPVEDPVDWLAARVSDGPFLYVRRAAILNELLKQRSVYRGFTGLASSSVTLLEHQVRAVRRVLEDPVRRYILADEVGLGKTIEAGVILRQHLLDMPRGGFGLVVVPNHLKAQWAHELTEKLGLPSSLFAVMSPAELPRRSATLDVEPSIVIVDEAHHAGLYAYGEQADGRKIYSALESVTRRARDVLLLSATPVLRNEAGFLAMLRLLDPAVYELDGLDGFRAFIKKREPVAQILEDLEGTPNDVIVEDALADAEEVLGDDERARALIAVVRDVLAGDEAPDSRARAIDDLRLHVQETHRFHHRLVRARRSARAIQDELPTRSFEQQGYEDPLRTGIGDWLDDWRVRARGSPAGEEAEELAGLFGEWFQATLENPCGLGTALHSRLKSLRDGQTKAAFDGEQEHLEEGLEVLGAGDEARLRILADTIRRETGGWESKVVLFASDPDCADGLAGRLTSQMVGRAARVHADAPSAIASYLGDGGVPVLVVDREGEEGLNLQGVKASIIHGDLPLSPMRIEQRIGRLDRLGGRAMTVKSIVPFSRNGYEQAVLEFLVITGVFEGSVASLQFLLDEVARWVAANLFESGIQAIHRATERMDTPGDPFCVSEERARLRRQDLLDDTGYVPADRSYFAALEDYEYGEGAEAFGSAASDWLGDGAIGFKKVDAGTRGVARYQYRGNSTQLSKRDFSSLFTKAIDRRYPGGPPTTHALSFDRACSVKNKVQLGRIGHPLIESMSKQIRMDERGMTFALWRHHSGVNVDADPSTYLRFDFLVEADVADRDPAARRRADAAFPPKFESVWVDDAFAVVNDEAVLRLLTTTKPLGATDETLRAGPLWQAATEGFADQWGAWCRRAAEVAIRHVRASPTLKEATHKARSIIEQKLAEAEAVLMARARRANTWVAEAELADVAAYRTAAATVLAGIEEPTIRPMFAGVIFLAGTRLPEPVAPEVTVE